MSSSAEDKQNSLATAALVVALVALFTTLSQVFQQYLSTADGYRRCRPSVIGPWARRTRRRWRLRELRLEVLFTVPHIVLYRTLWDSLSAQGSHGLPGSPVPYQDGGWIVGNPHKEGDDTNLLVSGNADPAPELVSWLRFLRSVQWIHKQSLFNFFRADPTVDGKELDMFVQENKKLTIPFVRFETRSWDFLPSEIIKPFARINLGDLGVIARRLGMEWEQFDPSNGVLRAQGNGYTLTSITVRSVGVMVEFTEIMGIGSVNDSLPWLAPILPDRARERILLIPAAAADKMVFGIVPASSSHFHARDFNVSSLPDIADTLRYFTGRGFDNGLVAAFESGEWQSTGWAGGVADLLALTSPMMYRPDLDIIGVPRPDNDLVFQSVADSGSAYVEFKVQVEKLLADSSHRDDKDLYWVSQKLDQFSEHERFWTRDIDWLEVYYRDDSAKRHDKEARAVAHEAHASATDMLLEIISGFKNTRRQQRGGWYFHLIQYHLRYLFDYAPFEEGRNQIVSVRRRLPYDLAPYPPAANVQAEIWQNRMNTYFDRLPVLIAHMLEDTGLSASGLSQAQAETAWILMMFRAFCWARCHTMVPGKTLGVKYCGSQMPCYLA